METITLEREQESKRAREVTALEVTSVSRWLFAAFTDWFWIVLSISIAIYFNNFFVYLVAIIIVGVKRHALTLLGHDGTHFLISKNKTLNDFLSGLFAFWPSYVGVTGYRIMHIDHHMYLGSQKDPELLHKRYTAPEWDLPMTKGSLVRRLCFDCIGGGMKEALTIFRIIGKPHTISDVLGPLFLHSAIFGGLYFFGGVILILKVLFIWNITSITSFIVSFRLRMMTEHLGLGNTAYRFKAAWWQGLLFLPHNTWHHFDHHMISYNVPFWNLPKLRALYAEPAVETVSDVFAHHFNATKMASGAPLRYIEETEKHKE